MEQVWERGERCVWRERWVACLRVLFLLWWEWLLFGWDLCEGEKRREQWGRVCWFKVVVIGASIGCGRCR